MSSEYKQEEIQRFISFPETDTFGERINKTSAKFHCQPEDSVFCLNAMQKSARLLACTEDLLASLLVLCFITAKSYCFVQGKICCVKPLFPVMKHEQEETWP